MWWSRGRSRLRVAFRVRPPWSSRTNTEQFGGYIIAVGGAGSSGLPAFFSGVRIMM